MASGKKALLGFIPLIVLAALVGGYLSMAANSTPTTTQSSVLTLQTGNMSEVTNSGLGLELALTINSSRIPLEEAINISASVTNVLSVPDNLSVASKWAIDGLSAQCNYGSSPASPIEIAVFSGNYTLDNISQAQALPIWGAIECPLDYAFNGTGIVGQWMQMTSYSLSPGADNGTSSGVYKAYPSQNLMMGEFPVLMTFQTQVYATQSSLARVYNSLNSSSPASYTVAAGDEWGQLALLHFQVVSSKVLPPGLYLASGGSD